MRELSHLVKGSSRFNKETLLYTILYFSLVTLLRIIMASARSGGWNNHGLAHIDIRLTIWLSLE